MNAETSQPDAEELAQFKAAVASLRRLDREIFLARIRDKMTFDEIAAATGLSREEAMRRMARAHIAVARFMAGRRSRWWRR